MKNRKIISIFTILLMLINIMPLTAFASETQEFTIRVSSHTSTGTTNLDNVGITVRSIFNDTPITVLLNETILEVELSTDENGYCTTTIYGLQEGPNIIKVIALVDGVEHTSNTHVTYDPSYVPPTNPVNNTQIEVGKTFGLINSIVEVPVRINNVDQLTGGRIVIDFDPDVVSFDSIENGEFLAGTDSLIENTYYTNGQVVIVFASANAKTGSGEIAKLKFRITGNQTTSISVSEIELEGDSEFEGQGRIIPATVKNGGITVGSLGDVDRNGRITTYDATLILRHVVGLTNLTEEQKIAADINGNEQVDTADAIAILQHIIGSSIF